MSIMQITTRLRVGHRIAGGFALVLFIAVMIAVIGVSGLRSTVNDLRDYAGEAEVAMRLGSITTDIGEMRRAQLRFMTTGESKALEIAKEKRARLSDQLATLLTQVSGDEREAVERMIAVMGDYNKVMDRTEVLRTRRDTLIRDTLEPSSAQVRKHLAAIVQAIGTRNAPEATAAAATTETAFYRAQLAGSRFLNEPSPDGARETRQLVEDFVGKSDELLGYLREPTLRRQASDAVNLAMDYSGAFDQVATAALESGEMSNVVMPKLGTEFATQAQRVKAAQDTDMARIHDSILVRTDNQVRLGITFAIAALVAGAALSWVIARGIVTPVRAMTTAMTRLANGNLTETVPATERQDELGDMGRAVQVFKDNAIAVERLRQQQLEADGRAATQRRQTMDRLVNDFEAHVSAAVGQVASAADEMVSTSHSMTAIAERTSSQAAAAAAAAEEASSNVQTVAAAAEELSASIVEIGRQVTHATVTANNAARRAEETDTIVRAMADTANRIGEVVGLITDIANQTNMLALNATIEAARAGDAGKGFAVVAGEVKGLATQTAKATSDIAEQISAIQAVTREAANAIHDISATIGEISDVSTAIAAAVEEQQAATREIARNVEQAAAGTAEVASNVAGVTGAAAEAGRAAALVLKESEALTSTSGELRHEAEGFIARVRQG